MPRTAIRYTLAAVAALAVASALVSNPTSAQDQLMSNIYKTDSDAKLAKPRTPKRFATQKGAGSNAVRRPIVFDHSGLITQGIQGMGRPTSIISGFNGLER